MTQWLLIGLASIGFTAAELPDEPRPTCTAKVLGPTYALGGGRMYFHFETTCEAPVDSISIKGTVTGPGTTVVGSKTCTLTDTCAFWVAASYKRGTWAWTNETTYTGGTSLATTSLTFAQ